MSQYLSSQNRNKDNYIILKTLLNISIYYILVPMESLFGLFNPIWGTITHLGYFCVWSIRWLQTTFK